MVTPSPVAVPVLAVSPVPVVAVVSAGTGPVAVSVVRPALVVGAVTAASVAVVVVAVVVVVPRAYVRLGLVPVLAVRPDFGLGRVLPVERGQWADVSYRRHRMPGQRRGHVGHLGRWLGLWLLHVGPHGHRGRLGHAGERDGPDDTHG